MPPRHCGARPCSPHQHQLGSSAAARTESMGTHMSACLIIVSVTVAPCGHANAFHQLLWPPEPPESSSGGACGTHIGSATGGACPDAREAAHSYLVQAGRCSPTHEASILKCTEHACPGGAVLATLWTRWQPSSALHLPGRPASCQRLHRLFCTWCIKISPLPTACTHDVSPIRRSNPRSCTSLMHVSHWRPQHSQAAPAW